MSAAPVEGAKPSQGTPVGAASGSPTSGGSGQGGSIGPVVGGVPATANKADVPASFVSPRNLRENTTQGQGTGDNDKNKAH
jgi:hypothetical protein